MPPACFLNAPTLRLLRMTGRVKTCHSEEPVRTLVTWESVSHSAEEFRFSPKKTLGILAIALATAAAAYILLALMAAARQRGRCSIWV